VKRVTSDDAGPLDRSDDRQPSPASTLMKLLLLLLALFDVIVDVMAPSTRLFLCAS